MFLGIDHGTTAIRFATTDGRHFQILRSDAGSLDPPEIFDLIKRSIVPADLQLAALCYSMGDGITKITRIEDAINGGLASIDGAGARIGGGTRVYEAMRESGWPVILLPGIHRGSRIDPRMKVFSHGASPEKLGLAYNVIAAGSESAVITDASSNTVTLAIAKGRVVGAIDAPIFAPGLLQGPLDVEAIREVDAGRTTANRAFSSGGILAKLGFSSLDGCPEDVRKSALETLALFSAMEMAAVALFLRDVGASEPDLFIAGDPAPLIADRVSSLIGRRVMPLGSFASADGCAMIAEAVFEGEDCIMGIEVDGRLRARMREHAGNPGDNG